MANIKFEKKFKYDGSKDEYSVQLKRKRLRWWIFLLPLLIPIFMGIVILCSKDDTQYIDPNLPKPTENCGVQFSSRHLSDNRFDFTDYAIVNWLIGFVTKFYEAINGVNISFGGYNEIFKHSPSCKYVGAGEYPSCAQAFPMGSFHGVAVDKGTRLIVYKEPNFQGDVLLDITGPVLINCSACTDANDRCMTKHYSAKLQELFPPEKRYLEDKFYEGFALLSWHQGSCKIICNQK